MNIVQIPGTNCIARFIALGDDKNLTPKALECGTIVLEKHIEALPAVRALGPMDCVIDVGAFIGDTALIFLKHTNHVYAFEPQPDAFFCLQYNCPLSINKCCAIGDGTPVVCLQDQMDDNLGTRTVLKDEAGCKSVRLDDLVFYPPPTFIKIDCEGFEPAVLRGAVELITACSPKLLIEIYPEMLARHGYVADDIYNVLRDLGYGYEPVIGNNTEPRWDILATKTRP